MTQLGCHDPDRSLLIVALVLLLYDPVEFMHDPDRWGGVVP